jgi:glycosyltransferase involved in cell wall biosynthesis
VTLGPGEQRAGDSAPLVSVVIPCHNYGRFLRMAIESALRQTHPRIEVIVVDDGSTDDSAEIAAGYPDVVCIRQPNLGQAAAQNRGLDAAGGEFVLFLDADDELRPEAVETFVPCLQDGPKCAFAYGHVQLVETHGAPLTARASRSARLQTCVEGDVYAHMLRTNNSLRSSGAVFYRTDVLRRVGGFALDVGNAQDLDLNLRLAREHAICGNDRIVLTKRIHDANSMLRLGPMLRGALVSQRRQADFVRRHPEYRRDYRAGLRRARSYWGSRLARRAIAELRTGDLRGAAGDLGTLVRYAPRAGAVEFGKILLRR